MGPHRYRIIVSGGLGKFTREIFEDLCIDYDGTNTGLTGELDQAALYGVLNRLMAFGLELVAVSRLDGEPAETGPARDVPPTEAAPPSSLAAQQLRQDDGLAARRHRQWS